jgi:putative membrane protein insertion efficiency factor
MKKIIISFIKVYSYLLSPLLGQNCRFYPTCSSYMTQAIEVHGVFKGLGLGGRRLLKCHPYHKGDMIDPVPLKEGCSGHCTHRHDQL